MLGILKPENMTAPEDESGKIANVNVNDGDEIVIYQGVDHLCRNRDILSRQLIDNFG